jgi:hypothetical protein
VASKQIPLDEKEGGDGAKWTPRSARREATERDGDTALQEGQGSAILQLRGRRGRCGGGRAA